MSLATSRKTSFAFSFRLLLCRLLQNPTLIIQLTASLGINTLQGVATILEHLRSSHPSYLCLYRSPPTFSTSAHVLEILDNMSGLFEEAFTPCPSRSRSSGSGSNAFDSFLDSDSAFEATGQVEYTTEIRAPVLTGAHPRRANRSGSTFMIHDDAMEKPPKVTTENRRRPNALTKPHLEHKSSLLAQPAQRFRPKTNFTPSPPFHLTKKETESQPKNEKHQTEINAETVARPKSNHSVSKHSKHGQDNTLKSNVRRNTVYIPPDDTTVASVFMGLFSPPKQQQTATLSKATDDSQINTLESKLAKRPARKSTVASPRRAPLQPSMKIAQEAAVRVDIAGKNGGKENIPPGVLIGSEKKQALQSIPSKPKRASQVVTSKPIQRHPDQRARSAKVLQPSTQSTGQRVPNRNVLGERQNNTLLSQKSLVHDKPSVIKSKEAIKRSPLASARVSVVPKQLDHPRPLQPSRARGLSSKIKELNQEYPRLVENTAKPALYEENWLCHQETVITQLVNFLLECTNGDTTPCEPATLRFEMLEIYHTEFFVQLHKRLQASLSCGTLGIPKELLSPHGRLEQDIGLRRKSLDIWVQSYDFRALVPAVETVFGRNVSNDPNFLGRGIGSPDDCTPGGRKAIVRKLEGFLVSFLLRNDDMKAPAPSSKETQAETRARAYRRTVLRSILLVVLLDQAKNSRDTSLPRQLFLKNSPFKSSVEVLQALTRVLLPTCGDIAKPLGHLGCQLTYKQDKLQEFNYQMSNIAVDLRDGVRLTRIVEVLFYTSEYAQSDTEDQTEVTLHTGETLSFLGDETSLPLSKHLKYPCVSKPAKLHNVQIALSALRAVKGSDSFLSGIRAEDIVDGYREKTIALLWALVSKWGLVGLVDWDDATKEIARLKKKAVSLLGFEKCESHSWFTGSEVDCGDNEHATVLQQWASILAALKGLSVTNMTTSFSNGKVYESIIDEYEPYFSESTRRNSMAVTGNSKSLESRLKLLGCSSQFGKYFQKDS